MTEQSHLPANWEPRKPAPEANPDPGPRKKSRYLPILLTLMGAVLLTVGSFFGCAASLGNLNSGRQSPWTSFFLITFAIGVLGTVVTGLGLIVRVIIDVFRDKKEV